MVVFPRNRYDASEFISAFDGCGLTRDGDEVCISFNTTHELTDEFTIYFPTCEGEPDSELVAIARLLCLRISDLDNLVQDSCEIECARKGLTPENYDLYIAYAEVERDAVRLEYVGSRVNTQWAACFRPIPDGTFVKTNF